MAQTLIAPLLTASEVAARIGVKASTVYAWAARGVLPHYRLGGLVRFDPAEVEAWARENHVHAGARA